MGIVNRTLDASQQKDALTFSIPAAGASTHNFFMVPRPMQLELLKVAGAGLSGAPTVQLQVTRFIAGAGVTTQTIGAALTVTAFGTSGMQGASLPAAGSTLLNLATGDILNVIVASGGIGNLLLSPVLKNLQDLRTSWGI